MTEERRAHECGGNTERQTPTDFADGYRSHGGPSSGASGLASECRDGSTWSRRDVAGASKLIGQLDARLRWRVARGVSHTRQGKLLRSKKRCEPTAVAGPSRGVDATTRLLAALDRVVPGACGLSR